MWLQLTDIIGERDVPTMWVEWSGRRWQSFYHSLRPSSDSEDDSVSNAKILELFKQIVFINPGKNDDDTDN